MSIIGAPEWTEYRKKNGLDPLGMQNTSVSLYQTLVPGISNVTLRMRYYGLYAWLAWVYARQIGDTNPKTWQRFIRRAEALYALTAERHGNESGVAGIQWAQRKLAGTGNGMIAFADDAEPGSPTHYLKQAWGAYGAAYGSQLFAIGVLSEARDHPVPLPSPEIGDALARSFDTELGGIGPRITETIERGTVSLAELDAFSVMLPSGIGALSEERQFYEDLLFARTAALQRPGDLNRRKTLLLILMLARHLGRSPEVEDIRWSLFAGCLPDGKILTFPPELDSYRTGWWAYQANDLSHVCFETLLKYILDTLAQHPNGLPLGGLIAEAGSGILGAADVHVKNWADFLESAKPAANAWSLDDDADLRLAERVMTAGRKETPCDGEIAWTAVRLLGIIHNRVRNARAHIADNLGQFDPAIFRSVLTETQFLDGCLYESFEETLGRLLEERVIRRHLWVALRKLRYQGDYTFLLEADDGRVRVRELDGPVFTNPRLGTASTFLRDIGLLDANGLTKQGELCIRSAA